MKTSTDYWRSVVDILRITHCCCRVKWSQSPEPTEWEPWLIVPTEGCIETGSLGPIPVSEVDWVEIDVTELQELGRLVAPRKVDHTSELIRHFEHHGVSFQKVDCGFRVLPQAA